MTPILATTKILIQRITSIAIMTRGSQRENSEDSLISDFQSVAMEERVQKIVLIIRILCFRYTNYQEVQVRKLTGATDVRGVH